MTLFKRAHAIFQVSLGPHHENTKTVESLIQQLITIAANRTTPREQPTRHDILQSGTRVMVQHVKPELNGKVGRVVKFDDEAPDRESDLTENSY